MDLEAKVRLIYGIALGVPLIVALGLLALLQQWEVLAMTIIGVLLLGGWAILMKRFIDWIL